MKTHFLKERKREEHIGEPGNTAHHE